MKEIGFDEMIQPRLGATWSPNGRDAVYASFARYYPAATSLPQAASWARNINRNTGVFFDAEGNLIGVDRSIGAASGKWFQEGISPRFIDEFAVGYDKQISRAWTGRIHARHRRAKNFWEDTNNDARLLYDPPEGVPQELYMPNLDEIRAELGGGNYVIAQLDGAYTKYYEISTEAEWRGSKGFFRGSYVWSHYYGNFDQDNSTTGMTPTSTSDLRSSPTAGAGSCGTSARATSVATGATCSSSTASTSSPGTAPSAPSASTSRASRGRPGTGRSTRVHRSRTT